MNASLVELVAGQLHLHGPEGSLLLRAPALRAACRCAGCRAAERAGVPPVAAPEVEVTRVSEVGAYALQLAFSDGHERGIYPWAYLTELASKTPPDRAQGEPGQA